MKLKNLSLAIFSAFMLSACGGSSSSDSNSNNSGTGTGTGTGTGNTTTNDSEWSAYSPSYFVDSDYLFDKLTFTSKGDTQYVRVDYLSSLKDMENLDINELYIFGDYLTNEGLYELELNKDPKLGYKIGSLLKNSVSEKTYIPSSKIGHTGLQLTEKYELVDLSGKPLAEYIDTHLYLVSSEPKLNNYGDFGPLYLSKLKGKTFPNGSKCLRGLSLSSSKDFIIMYQNPYDTYDSFQDIFSEGYKTINLGGYNTFISNSIYPNEYISALVQVDNKYRYGEYNKSGTYYSLSKEIEIETQILKELKSDKFTDAEEILEQELYIQTLQKECTVINSTASQEIDKYLKFK